jgi:hypothetical protein
MGFIFGIGHSWEGQMIVFEITHILTIDNREPHWSNTEYTDNGESNSRTRGCVLCYRVYKIGQ